MNLSYLILSILFIFISGFFAGVETGFFSLDSILLKFKSKSQKWEKKLLKLTSKKEDIILVTLIGTNFSIIASTQLMVSSLGNFKFNYLFMVFIFPFIVLIFGEIFPKMIYSKIPFKLSKISYYPFIIFKYILFPFTIFFRFIVIFFDKIFNIKKSEIEELNKDYINFYLKKSIKNLIGGKDNLIDIFIELETYKTVHFKKPFSYYNLIIFNNDLEYNNCSFSKLKDKVLNILEINNCDYIIITKKDFTKVYGYLNIKKIFNLLYSNGENENTNDKFYMIDFPVYISESSSLLYLFEEYNKINNELFFTINEFGAISGIINIKDIFIDFSGQILLQNKNIIFYTEKISENSYIFDGNLNFKFFKKFVNFNFDDKDFSTLNGFLLYVTGKMMRVGEKYTYDNFIFEIISSNKILPNKIKVTILK
jgi:CBS domain containing-hemolysin-like protein